MPTCRRFMIRSGTCSTSPAPALGIIFWFQVSARLRSFWTTSRTNEGPGPLRELRDGTDVARLPGQRLPEWALRPWLGVEADSVRFIEYLGASPMNRCESCTILLFSAFRLQRIAGFCIDLQKREEPLI